MPFTVTWHPSASDELIGIWIRAPDRIAVTRATDMIDKLLAEDPQTKGEDFYGDRLLVVQPLAVTYSVNEDDRLVQVLQVWHQSRL